MATETRTEASSSTTADETRPERMRWPAVALCVLLGAFVLYFYAVVYSVLTAPVEAALRRLPDLIRPR
jgi:hypothetical protein